MLILISIQRMSPLRTMTKNFWQHNLIGKSDSLWIDILFIPLLLFIDAII